MDYQYLYGSVQEFYRSVAVTGGVPDSWRQRISGQCERFLRYGRDGAPHNYTWMLQGDDAEKKWVFSCCGEKQQAHAPSYFMHAHLHNCGAEDFLKNFDAHLQTPFYTEAQFDALAAGEDVAAPAHHWSGSREELPIPAETLRAILYGIVNRWRVSAQPVVIAVPASENYDSYTYRAVRTIYSRLPAALRACAGFMTYAKPDEKLTQIALFFVPEDVAPENALRLDGSGAAPRQFLDCSLSAAFKELLDTLVTSNNREELLRKLLLDVEIPKGLESLRGADYVNYHLQRNLLSADAANPEIFRQWVTIAAKPESCPETLRRELLSNVDRCVSPQILLSHAEPLWSGAPSALAAAEAIAELLPLCAQSSKLTAPVETKLIKALDAALAQATSLADAQNTLEQLQNIFVLSKNTIPSPAATKKFAIRCGNRQIDLVEAMCIEAKARLEKMKLEIPDPTNFYRAATLHLDKFKKSLQGNWQNNVQQACQSAYASLFESFEKIALASFREAASIHQSNTPVSSAYYEQEIARLRTLRSQLPADTMLQNVGQELDKTIQDLTAQFASSNIRRDEQLQQFTEADTNYFKNLARLQQADAVSTDDKFDMVANQLRNYRPASYDKYLEQFQTAYGFSLSLESLSSLSNFQQEVVLQDMDMLLSTALEINLAGYTWAKLIQVLTHKQAYTQIFCRKQDTSVILHWSDQFFRMGCCSLLDILTVLDSESTGVDLHQVEIKNLCLLLRRSGVINDEKLPAVMGFLLRNNMTAAANILADETMMLNSKNPPSLSCRCRIYDLLQIDSAASHNVVNLLKRNPQWPQEAESYISFVNSIEGEDAPAQPAKRRAKKQSGTVTLPLWGLIAGALVTIALAAALVVTAGSGGKEPTADTTVTTSATETTGTSPQSGNAGSGPKVNID